jgi:hypothetical protein
MTKIYLLPLFFTFIPFCWGQINVDELLIELHRNYEITGKRDYLQEEFTVFVSKNRMDEYHVFLDSNGIVNEYIGLSIVHYSFDEISRPTLIEGFNSKGERYYWDFPPITKYRYVSDTIMPYFTNIRQHLYPQSILDTLYNLTIEEEINIEKQSNFNLKRYTVYTKDSACILRFSVCSKGSICRRSNGEYFNYRELNPSDKKTILHERFYDTLFQLVEAPHEYSIYDSRCLYYHVGISYAYSKRKLREDDEALYEMRFFNAQGEEVWFQQKDLVAMFNRPSPGFSGGPIYNPASKWQSFWSRFRLRR